MWNGLMGIIIIISFIFMPYSYSATVTLKSGQVITAKILAKTADYVEVDYYGIKLTYYLDEVASIDEQISAAEETSTQRSAQIQQKSKVAEEAPGVAISIHSNGSKKISSVAPRLKKNSSSSNVFSTPLISAAAVLDITQGVGILKWGENFSEVKAIFPNENSNYGSRLKKKKGIKGYSLDNSAVKKQYGIVDTKLCGMRFSVRSYIFFRERFSAIRAVVQKEDVLELRERLTQKYGTPVEDYFTEINEFIWDADTNVEITLSLSSDFAEIMCIYKPLFGSGDSWLDAAEGFYMARWGSNVAEIGGEDDKWCFNDQDIFWGLICIPARAAKYGFDDKGKLYNVSVTLRKADMGELSLVKRLRRELIKIYGDPVVNRKYGDGSYESIRSSWKVKNVWIVLDMNVKHIFKDAYLKYWYEPIAERVFLENDSGFGGGRSLRPWE